MGDVHKTYALVIGIVAGIIGIWGFFSGSILGIFGVNGLQSVLHLIAAVTGIYAGTKGDGHTYGKVLGWISLALGVLGFIPGISDLFLTLFNINTATSVLHLLVGIISLGLVFGVKK